MPDANGNVKGISVPRVPWHERPAPLPVEWLAYQRASERALERHRKQYPELFPRVTYGPHWPD